MGYASIPPDATNFYVGHVTNYAGSGNHNTKPYAWAAIA